MIEIILYSLTVSYVTHILLFDHDGPFPDKHRSVQADETLYRPVHLFDWFRRLLCSYTVEGFVWHLKYGVLWSCPYCLSFWINLVLLLPFCYFTYHWGLFPLLLFSIPMVSVWLND